MNFQILLPKSTNIFANRFQTIWPTIKYLIKKKLMRFNVFKDNEEPFSIWKNTSQEEKNHEKIQDENIKSFFGSIEED